MVESSTIARGARDANMHVAVLVPCFNEAVSIGTVVRDFRAALPGAEIHVYDNNSNDETVAQARKAGATIGRERLQGKGNVVRRMFADVEADIYVLVDGDDTYEAAAAPIMVSMLIEEGLDYVTAARLRDQKAAYRPGHMFGNSLLTGIVARIFGNRVSDMLSGYRVFSRRFVKSFPALSTGFEIETELTVHALELRMPGSEYMTQYKERPAGSHSKLNTLRDGIRIAQTIFHLVKEEKPLPFFSALGALLVLTALALGIPVVLEFLETGLVPRLPTAVLVAMLTLLGFLSFTSGIILDGVSRGRKEAKRLRYLSIPAVRRELNRPAATPGPVFAK